MRTRSVVQLHLYVKLHTANHTSKQKGMPSNHKRHGWQSEYIFSKN